jgi:hypothetical protein
MDPGGDRARDVDVPLECVLCRGGDVRIGANMVREELDREILGNGSDPSGVLARCLPSADCRSFS